MRVIEPSYELRSDISYGGILELQDIEEAARTCYRSEDKIEEQGVSAKRMIKKLIEMGHEAMLEHSSLSIRLTCDRAVANELVRHRLASFAQESTRYCNYGKDKFGNEITVVKPVNLEEGSNEWNIWRYVCLVCEVAYMNMLKSGIAPQDARAVLPLSLATNIVVTANYREWRHILKLRTAPDAHPDIRYLMTKVLEDLQERIPVIFDDI